MRRCFGLFGLLIVFSVFAETPEQQAELNLPHIAIIIDDMGNRLIQGERAIALPGDVTLNILPFTPHARHLATLARKHQKEIMLHIPMEAMSKQNLGYGGLHSDMDYAEFQQTLNRNLSYLPHVSGISNHMGSRLTQDETMMDWLMAGLLSHGQLYFVDSRTTSKSIAFKVARKNKIRYATRDVFLDHHKDDTHMQQQWQRLIRLARSKGSAVAIGHPLKTTMDFLETKLPQLNSEGIRLVRVSDLMDWRQLRRKFAWQTSLSHSPRAAKN